MRRLALAAALFLAAPGGTARANPAEAAPRVLRETAEVVLPGQARPPVSLRVPLAIHRGANAFRLYGARPLTLRSRERRRDLYRDAFLELATRERLTPRTTAWDSLSGQLRWLRSTGAALRAVPRELLPPAPGPAAEVERSARELLRRASSLPGYRHVAALTAEIDAAGAALEPAAPLREALQLRALATDEAESRLQAMGRALELEGPATDPALRDGYRAAAAEFEQVRQGLWPAVAAGLRKSRGRLLLSAVKEVVLSPLGAWAIFGHLGWKSAEGLLNTEYGGQFSICLATVAAALARAGERAPEYLPLALYAEYALNHQLSETLKDGQVMALKPAGGRTAASWQIQFYGRCEELRRLLAPGEEPRTSAGGS